MKRIVYYFILALLLGSATSLKAQTLSYDFEDGTYQGWICIDADGDDDCWWLLEEQWGLTGHNDSHYLVISASYPSPDNYFVAPEKRQYSQISFWVCSDKDYSEEHFGIAVSTGDKFPEDNYTTIEEWTIPSNDGSKAQGPWYEYTADLSDYAGQEIWVAIRHFNCNQHILFLDDITIISSPTDVEEHYSNNSFKLYPNPVNEKFIVENDQVVNQYEIYNILGEMIAGLKVNSNTFEVDATGMPAGVYFIRLNSEGLVQTKRFVKKQ